MRHFALLVLCSIFLTIAAPAFAQEGDPDSFETEIPPASAPYPAAPGEQPPVDQVVTPAPPTATFDPARPVVPFEAMPPEQNIPPQFVGPQGQPIDPADPAPQGDVAQPNVSPELTKDPGKYGQEVELRALNKVTTRTETLNGPLATPMTFGNLEIIVKTCWSAGPDKRPEHAALMDIVEQVPGEGPKTVFSGWMFASSPGLSALEHAVYDITVIACHDKKDDAKQAEDKKEADAKKKDDVKKAVDKKPANKKVSSKKKAASKPDAAKPAPIPPVAPVTGVLRLPSNPPIH